MMAGPTKLSTMLPDTEADRGFSLSGMTTLQAALIRSRPISVHRNILNMVGSASAGILLSQLIYWTRHGTEVVQRDGWVFKTAEQWHRETGMTWKVQRRARQRLCRLGLVEERRVALPCRLEFRLNLNVLASKTSEHIRMQINELSLDLFRSEHQVIKDLLGPVVAYHRVLADLVPHVNAALLLSRCLFGMRRRDGSFGAPNWLALSRDQWKNETALSRDEWETARRHLRQRGLLIEKHANYPRRVDLMVACDELAVQLQQLSTGGLSTGRTRPEPPSSPRRSDVKGDRAIQGSGNPEARANPAVGGIGRYREAGFPQPTSPIPSHPDAAFKNRPIPPSTIAHSLLYKKEGLQEGLQPPLQRPPAQASLDLRPPLFAAPVVGVVVIGTSPNPTKPPATVRQASIQESQPAAAESEAGDEGSKHATAWPNCIAVEDRQVVLRHLAGLPPERAQELLDEMAWQNGIRPITHGPSYVRRLRGAVDAGTFVADGAHRVVLARQRAAVEKVAQAARPVVPGLPPEDSSDPGRSSEVRANLHRVRQAILARMAGGGSGVRI